MATLLRSSLLLRLSQRLPEEQQLLWSQLSSLQTVSRAWQTEASLALQPMPQQLLRRMQRSSQVSLRGMQRTWTSTWTLTPPVVCCLLVLCATAWWPSSKAGASTRLLVSHPTSRLIVVPAMQQFSMLFLT